MLKFLEQKNNHMLLKAAYFDSQNPNFVAVKNGAFTEDLQNNTVYIYINKDAANYYELNDLLKSISSYKRDLLVDLESFVRNNLSLEEVIRLFYSRVAFDSYKLFKKTNKEDDSEAKEVNFLLSDLQKYEALTKKLEVVYDAINKCRDLQIMPENFLNSENLSAKVVSDLAKVPNLTLNVLTKKEIEDLKMGLLLSVNKGSTHESRVVVIEYNGNPESKEKTVLVGKGITFDTGGVNTKGYHMEGMKFDMSGSVIVAYAVKAIAQLGIKANFSALMMITDNRLAGDASLPENIYQSMSGKWVEVSDTDAEGRLVLADGLYYAATELKATKLIDVATLTGSLSYALGKVYTGVWATNDKDWASLEQAAKNSKEKVWRMPLHEDFHKTNKESKTADLQNYSSSSKSDSNSAAMFLKEFTNEIDYVHCDVAFTADINGEPQGCLISSFVELAQQQGE
ncbi:M17 family metallopeptidase [Mycoplasma sp. Ms02]|uniref:M17 family metallopeptidase n=1 Tax=Mycoplasma sp. Ms02 TaxID=353851 RepID=UPI001C89BC03|nr:leucyl aminopeptidase family protein [Mycoplasma sp. Ms02]QZE12649.1 leucyl aminopeptidase family protein [Mycoplasma sp. Ms02]